MLGGLIVLFSSPEVGTVVGFLSKLDSNFYTNPLTLGHWSNIWEYEEFKDLPVDHQVILSNDGQ